MQFSPLSLPHSVTHKHTVQKKQKSKTFTHSLSLAQPLTFTSISFNNSLKPTKSGIKLCCQ